MSQQDKSDTKFTKTANTLRAQLVPSALCRIFSTYHRIEYIHYGFGATLRLISVPPVSSRGNIQTRQTPLHPLYMRRRNNPVQHLFSILRVQVVYAHLLRATSPLFMLSNLLNHLWILGKRTTSEGVRHLLNHLWMLGKRTTSKGGTHVNMHLVTSSTAHQILTAAVAFFRLKKKRRYSYTRLYRHRHNKTTKNIAQFLCCPPQYFRFCTFDTPPINKTSGLSKRAIFLSLQVYIC